METENKNSLFGPFIEDGKGNLFFQAGEFLGPIFIVENDEQKQKLKKYNTTMRFTTGLILFLCFIYIIYHIGIQSPINKDSAASIILIILPFFLLNRYILNRLEKTIKKLSFSQSMALLARQKPYFLIIGELIWIMYFTLVPIKHALNDIPPNSSTFIILLTALPLLVYVFVRTAYIGVLKHYFSSEMPAE